MKQLFLVFLLLTCCHVFSQAGVYVIDHTNDRIDGTKTKWTLTLNEDGTFLYHFLRDISAVSKANKEENYYAKGTWKLEGKIVTLFSEEKQNPNQLYTLNLNKSKARYITKSPRDKSDKVIKTALRFYESETFHIIGLELFKE
jgi:hypothetical protein